MGYCNQISQKPVWLWLKRLISVEHGRGKLASIRKLYFYNSIEEQTFSVYCVRYTMDCILSTVSGMSTLSKFS